MRIPAAALLALLLTPCARAAAPAVPYGNNPAAGHYYDIRGFKMYCEEYGQGPALLMIHGNGGSMAAFSRNVGYFAQKYHVILADSRSQGKSADLAHPISFEMMADDFAALLDTLHVPQAYVIGWSDGGINALLLAMRHPGLVRAMAISGANLWPGEDAFAPGIWAGIVKQYHDSERKVWTTDREMNDWKLFMLDYEQPHIAAEDLKAVKCPCLVICGDHDMISIPHTVLIYRSLPKAELWVVPDSGHATLMEHPADFDRVVDGFFSAPFHAR
ncbi:MAG TPA: alpha/beta hydrolase [Opitutaceae bacterium]|jgi:pimeloyl-ACP methyl ester carboxylesterase